MLLEDTKGFTQLQELFAKSEEERQGALQEVRQLHAVAVDPDQVAIERDRARQWEETASLACAELEVRKSELRATKGSLQAIRDSLRCPINHRVCADPVIASDGHTYDRTGIGPWISLRGTSPLTRELLRRQLIPNRQFKTILTHLAEGLGEDESKGAEVRDPGDPGALEVGNHFSLSSVSGGWLGSFFKCVRGADAQADAVRWSLMRQLAAGNSEGALALLRRTRLSCLCLNVAGCGCWG